MDMSEFNLVPAFPVDTKLEQVDGTLASTITETALELANLEAAVSDFLDERLLLLDCSSRAHLARVRDAISSLAIKVGAAAGTQPYTPSTNGQG